MVLLYVGFGNLNAILYPYSTGFGCTNYIGNGGTFGAGSNTYLLVNGQSVSADTWTGPYADNGSFSMSTPFRGVKLATITALDGTANTVAFGETLGGASPDRDYLITWMGAGCMSSNWGLPSSPSWHTYGSMHNGVVNFSFCDGSVRTFRKGIATSVGSADWLAFQQAMGYKDGATPDWSLITN